MSSFVIDLETDALENPTVIWVAVVRDVDHLDDFVVFERPDLNPGPMEEYLDGRDCFIGHNFIDFDYRVLEQLAPSVAAVIPPERIIDTFILSRLLNYRREGGHSIEALSNLVGGTKVGADISDWSEYTPEMRDRCINDTLVNARLFNKWRKYTEDKRFEKAIRLEHDTAFICSDLHRVGFPFDRSRAIEIRQRLGEQLEELDRELTDAFPPKTVLDKIVVPRETKHGTIYAHDFNRLTAAGIDPKDIVAGRTYELYKSVPFEPGSIKQIVERLNEAGWKPTDKTEGHIKAIKSRDKDRIHHFKEWGWKVNEENLKTLPETAPSAARKLAQRLILASRMSDLDEWLAVVVKDVGPFSGWTIHGRFNGIGGWTQRKSTAKPNMQNIPVAKRTKSDSPFIASLHDLSDELRSLWIAPPGWRLIGTDADGIQMRIFAHYVNDDKLTKALINGNKDDGSDIHSLHWKALGDVCRGRDPAKTFIYAWLLGAGIAKVAEILGCSYEEARLAVESFLAFYPGLSDLKKSRIPFDAERGFLIGLDGRPVIVKNEHEVLACYLQNGESIIMKTACKIWREELDRKNIPFFQVNDVHDEWQTLTWDSDDLVKIVGDTQVSAIRKAGEILQMNLPLDGQWKDGYSWKETH